MSRAMSWRAMPRGWQCQDLPVHALGFSCHAMGFSCHARLWEMRVMKIPCQMIHATHAICHMCHIWHMQSHRTIYRWMHIVLMLDKHHAAIQMVNVYLCGSVS